ncbi:hypothetical protein RFI_24312 [Reticulomyxa filosa]|uniref:Uncharacterized protein n=1 Tax=Reticulomyxa filosa TaxID=46433 RepID=X6MJ20_RETFI|nr:hypothetical protein RFI_24312 [Reticulomyxa filosa]|eukprot:ETO13065.1 hypothetical protein RFI_24312 [Reticulomyxa filosa]
MTSLSVHVLKQLCDFTRCYAFYIVHDMDLLTRSMQYLASLPNKQPLVVYQCSQAFVVLVTQAKAVLEKNPTQFLKVVDFVLSNIKTGEKFYFELPVEHLMILKDFIMSDTNDEEPTALDVINHQQRGCSQYLQALCMIIDNFDASENAQLQKELAIKIISPYLKTVKTMIGTIADPTKVNEKIELSAKDFYQLTWNYHMICGVVKGMDKVRPGHPLMEFIPAILSICEDSCAHLPQFFNKTRKDKRVAQRRAVVDSTLPTSLQDISIDILFDRVVEIMECLTDVWKDNLGKLLDPLVKLSLQLLHQTKSPASARILRKMIEVFHSNKVLGPKFVTVVIDTIKLFGDPSVDMRECTDTVREILQCAGLSMRKYHNLIFFFFFFLL